MMNLCCNTHLHVLKFVSVTVGIHRIRQLCGCCRIQQKIYIISYDMLHRFL